MKTYYVLVRFGTKFGAVTGFVVPNCSSTKDALSKLKSKLIKHKKKYQSELGELSTDRINLFLRSLKKHYKTDRDGKKIVRFIELSGPIYANYWLHELGQESYLCNKSTSLINNVNCV